MEGRKRAAEEEATRSSSTTNLAPEEEEEGDGDLYVPLKDKRAKIFAALKSRHGQDFDHHYHNHHHTSSQRDAAAAQAAARGVSLLDQAAVLKKEAEKHQETPEEKLRKEEEQFLEINKHKKKLMSATELAKGIEFTEPMRTNWRPPRKYRTLSEKEQDDIREKWQIDVEGEDIPSPIKAFKDMRFPKPVLDKLKERGIKSPTPIQVQGLPVVLSGRDMIGIAFTGSGKTLVFVLPMVMLALEQEKKLPLVEGEGPISLVVVPSRELARQIHQVAVDFAGALARVGEPPLRILLCIGGINLGEQMSILKKGPHIICSTPGRLKQLLEVKKINLISCRLLVLDEADRMVDVGFEDDVREIMSYFRYQRQTLLFSATMPRKIQDFVKASLVKPIVVNVGRAGAASLDVVQEVEYVKEEAKIVYLLECLQKTPPPVLIFTKNKKDVDDIHGYLLLKGVVAVAIHADKSQEERSMAIDAFKSGKKDVLVATDVASKGLDFAKIEHVINFDMPSEIEDYVHRIGRTGRGGKTGLATTFVNKSCSEQILLDLKHLLREAKQKIPPFLAALEEQGAGNGCAYCGGLGHTIAVCPKLESNQRKEIGAIRGAGGARGGDM